MKHFVSVIVLLLLPTGAFAQNYTQYEADEAAANAIMIQQANSYNQQVIEESHDQVLQIQMQDQEQQIRQQQQQINQYQNESPAERFSDYR